MHGRTGPDGRAAARLSRRSLLVAASAALALPGRRLTAAERPRIFMVTFRGRTEVEAGFTDYLAAEIKDVHDPLLPIIMVTARTSPDDVVRTFAAGADDYVAKPFHVAELTARIESRLRVHRAEVAIKRANQQLRELADQNYQLYEQARRDAEERSLLLRELDHRVRNNLSVILGLLSMERNRRPPRPEPPPRTRMRRRAS